MFYLYYVFLIELIFFSGLQLSSKYRYLCRKIYWFNIVCLILFAGFKDPNLTADGPMYVSALKGDEFIIEPTFNILCRLIKNFLNSQYVWIFLVYSSIAIFTKAVSILHLSKLCLLCLLVWVSDFFPLHELGQIRAAVAGGFFLLSIPSLYEHRLKSYLGWTLIALCFHISSIIMLMLWPLKVRMINPKFWVLMVVASMVWALLNIDILFIVKFLPFTEVKNKYEAYLILQSSLEKGANVFSPLVLGKFIIVLFLLTKVKILRRVDPRSILYLKIMLVSVIARNVLATNVSIAFRVSEFFGIIEIILFPLIIYLFKQRIAGYMMVVVIAILLSSIRMFSNHLILLEP